MLRVKTKITEMKHLPLKNEERKQRARSSVDRLTVNTGRLPSPVDGIVVTSEMDRSYIQHPSCLMPEAVMLNFCTIHSRFLERFTLRNYS